MTVAKCFFKRKKRSLPSGGKGELIMTKMHYPIRVQASGMAKIAKKLMFLMLKGYAGNK
ncbi:hypothetical protein [uncultured Cohaesibacter sp.]|uniref:hypothetical protein n=1 Tax=uncultured Cohaesibacter sp. TaxID=1002546 RepID=UPI0029315651|nr:hypothetical protein [uncultured Cohaesibacter sp.]